MVIGSYAFQDCTALVNIEFKNVENWKVCPHAYDNFQTGEWLNSSSLSKASTAANYLTKTYVDKYFAVVSNI